MNDSPERFPGWRCQVPRAPPVVPPARLCVVRGGRISPAPVEVPDGLGGSAAASRGADMAIAETTYLYALAGLSVSFVGFSTLVIVFRQSAGGRLSSYDSYFVLSFMQAGFIVTAGALLPPLFALYGCPRARCSGSRAP